MNTFKQMLQARGGWNPNGLLGAHLVPFAGDGGWHDYVPYDYRTPSVIKSKFDLLQWAGVDFVVVTWQGSGKPVNQQATLQIAFECERRGMQFALLIDPAVYSSWQAKGFKSAEACVITELTNADGGALLASPAYLADRYILQFDPSGFVTAAVAANVPGFNFLQIHSGFSWINSKASYADVLADFKLQHSNASMVLPSVWWAFNDSGQAVVTAAGAAPSALASSSSSIRMDANGLDLNLQSWAGVTKPSRVLFDRKGKTFYDILATVNPASKYLLLGTWDDTNEGSAFETMFSVMSGIQVQ